MTDKQTHYRRNGKPVAFDYFTVRPELSEYGGGFVVHGFGTYGSSSVLAGQSMKSSVAHFDTMAAALEVYPEADTGHDLLDPQVSLRHLPDEDDLVPGGAYPDDWT